MLSGVNQITSLVNNNITLKLTGNVAALPKVNSIVFLEVIEKKGDNFRILINGKVFQSKLPFKVGEGEQLFAKVLSKEPFTLVINDFGKQTMANQAFISTVIANFDLKDNDFNKSLIDKIVSSKKVLSKSKLKRIVEYFEATGQKVDDLQLSLLVQIFWSFEKEQETLKNEELSKFLKTSFDDLAANIKFLLIELNDLYPDELITTELNSIFLYRIPFSENRIIDRDKKVYELMELINSNQYSNSLINPDKLSELKQALLLYIIQKSLYNYYNFFPDFLITKINYNYDIVIYFIQPRSNKLGILSFETNYSIKSGSNKIGFEGVLSHDSIKFNVYTESSQITKLSYKLKNWDAKLVNDLQVKVYTSIKDSRLKVKDGTIIGVTKGINRKA